MIDEERVSSLLVKHEEGVLSGAEMLELEELLASDATVGRLLVDHYSLTSEIETILARHEPMALSLSDTSSTTSSTDRPRLRSVPIAAQSVGKPTRWPRRGFTAALAVAASVMVVLGAKGFFPHRAVQSLSAPGASSAYATVRGPGVPGEIVGTRGRRVIVTGVGLDEGDSIEVGQGGVAVLGTEDGSRIELSAGARFTIGEHQVQVKDGISTRALRLDKGIMRARVTRQPAGHFLVFVTPHARATILGTELSLTVEEHSTQITVAHGQVLFEGLDDGTRVTVGTGQSATTRTRSSGSDASSPALLKDSAPDAMAPTGVFWDFEDGVLPSSFLLGQLVAGPARPGSRMAVVGTLYGWGDFMFTIGIESRTPMIRYSDESRVAFDYWLPAEGSEIAVQIRNRNQKQNYNLVLKQNVREAWTHLDLRLADFQPISDKTKVMEPGDIVDHLYILGGRMGGGPFFVDNIKVWNEP